MLIGIEIAIVYLDYDLLELRISCSNGRFSGEIKAYSEHEKLSELAKTLDGFPTQLDDERNFLIGTFDPKYGGGGIRLHFHCVDSLGHAGVDIDLRGDPHTIGHTESSSFFLKIEAAAVDKFVIALRNLRVEVGAVALLHGAT